MPDSPEMNGFTERMNRTILENTKCMCAHADLPKSLWAEAASTACYVYNRLPNAPLKCKSPHEVWYSRKPDLSRYQPAEVPIELPVDVPARQREDPKAVATPREREQEPVAEHTRPIRDRKQVLRYGVEEQLNIAEEVIASAQCAAETDEPKTMNQARKRPDAKKWLKAAQDEMDSLLEHDTWSLTKPPLGRKIIGSKWVFKIKHDANGEAERYKCRLVAQGYTQAQGIDYHETFAPVARLGSMRALLAIAAKRKMFVHQMDDHTAFLNGKLDEDIYMCHPEDS